MVENPFTLSGFQQEINNHGTAQANKYQINIKAAPRGIGVASTNMLIRCDSVSMAGRTLNTGLMNEYGLIKKIAYRNTFTDFNTSFICSKDLREKTYITKWMNKISPTPDSSKLLAGNAFDVEYYDKYIGTIEVTLLDENLFPSHHITYHEAYPLTTTEMALGYGTNNSFLRLNVTWAYAYWVDSKDSSSATIIEEWASLDDQ